MTTRNDILRPIDVSGIYPVLKNSHVLKGFRVAVTYDGCTNITDKHFYNTDVLPLGRGCRFGKVQYENGQSKIDYIFYDGLFLSDAMERAYKFKKNVKNIIDMRPLAVSGVDYCFFLPGSDRWTVNRPSDVDCICVGYRVIVGYPGDITKNPFSKYVIQKPDCNIIGIEYDKGANMTDVIYYIENTRHNDQEAYHRASMFQSVMYCQIKSDRNNNMR